MILRYKRVAIAVFITALLIIAAYFWLQAAQESKRLRHGLQLTYELMIAEKSLQTQLNLSNIKSDTDNLNDHLTALLSKTKALETFLETSSQTDGIDDPLLQHIQAISLAHSLREPIERDYVTLRALINNSFIWLRAQEKYRTITASEALLFNRIMDGFYATDLEEQIPTLPYSPDPLIQQHLRVLYDTVLEINTINVQLEHSRTDKQIENLALLIEADLDVQERLRTFLMWSFIASITTALFLALILYRRERNRYKQTLRLSHDLEQFIQALDESNIISKTDINGRITHVNDTFCSISGYTRDELIGESHSIVRHPDNPPSLFKELWQTILKGSIFKIVLKNKAKDGSEYYVDTTIIPIKNETDEITEFLSIRHDVTELVQARDKAIAAEQFKDRFLSNMSHELRTPLNGIIGFAQLLERKLVDPTQNKYLKSILESSAHLLNIINDILDLSKIKSGAFTLEPHPAHLHPLFLTLLERFEVQTQSKNILFTHDLLIPKEQMVQGDWLRISQIISNLLSNACKFTPENGKIAFKAAYADGVLTCTIADSGIGMDERTLQRIFRPFEQADISITRQYGGTGLGLSITKELLEQMEGKIDVYSRAGAGSRFTVSIPLPSVAEPETISKDDPEPVADVPLLSGHVLVVEDNDVNQMVITLLLDEFGLHHTCANDGDEAVNMFQEGVYDLILMDENMPNLSGIEAMKAIRKLPGGSLPILALTANTMAGDKERFLEAGMDGFIAKPVTFDSLKEALRAHLKPQ